MPELSTHLTFISDPGYGWVRVPLVDIAGLGIEEEITAYSFIEGQYATWKKIATVPAIWKLVPHKNIPARKSQSNMWIGLHGRLYAFRIHL